MAQVKISALTAADPLTGIEEAPFVQGGATKKATTEQIREYVASQPNVFSVTQRIEDAAPALQFSENDTVDQNWEFIGVAGALRLDELNDAFSTTGTHHTFTHGGGTQFGSPAGGDQGAGTVNATGLFENGTGVAKLSGGADANFTAMPQVGGDAATESGSNANGHWQKFADGTMRQRIHRLILSFNSAADVTGTWTFPQEFIDEDYALTTTLLPQLDTEGPGAVADDASVFRSGLSDTGTGNYTTTSVDVAVYRIAGGNDFAAGDEMYMTLIAEGRWKA